MERRGELTDQTVRVTPAAIVLALGALVSHGFGLSLVPALLPHIEREFQSGYGVLGLAVATGLLAYALGAAIASRVLRVVPTKPLLLATFAVSGIGFVSVAASNSPALIALAVSVLGVSAPISWTATIHIGRETVPARSAGVVLAGASGGAAFGAVVNGVLVQTSDTIHPWRVSFLIAASVAILVIVLAARLFPNTIDKPERSGSRVLPVFGRVLRDPSGMLVVVTSGVSGVAVFTLATFLTATAIDEMGTSAILAAALLWIGGTVGVVAAVVFGRIGDRTLPTFAIAMTMTTYAVTLLLLALGWSFEWLVVAMVGYGVLNGPVWGLMGALANARFTSELSVGAVSLGLVAASVVGAIGNSVSAFWLEGTGSMRGPVVALALLTTLTAIYLVREARRARVLGTKLTDDGAY
jgi:predicted MFS family arabinose efflux permease